MLKLVENRKTWVFIGGLIFALAVSFMGSGLVGSAQAKTYKQYVASLPDGCQPVPRECFEQAVAGKTFAMYDWAAWWPEKLYKGFEKEFGIKITKPLDKKTIEKMLTDMARNEPKKFQKLVDTLNVLGLEYATKRGVTLSLEDFVPIAVRNKEKLIAEIVSALIDVGTIACL